MKRTLTKGLILGTILGLAFAEGGILPATSAVNTSTISPPTVNPITSSSVTTPVIPPTPLIFNPLNGDSAKSQKSQNVQSSTQQVNASKSGSQDASANSAQPLNHSVLSSQSGQNASKTIPGVYNNQAERNIEPKLGQNISQKPQNWNETPVDRQNFFREQRNGQQIKQNFVYPVNYMGIQNNKFTQNKANKAENGTNILKHAVLNNTVHTQPAHSNTTLQHIQGPIQSVNELSNSKTNERNEEERYSIKNSKKSVEQVKLSEQNENNKEREDYQEGEGNRRAKVNNWNSQQFNHRNTHDEEYPRERKHNSQRNDDDEENYNSRKNSNLGSSGNRYQYNDDQVHQPQYYGNRQQNSQRFNQHKRQSRNQKYEKQGHQQQERQNGNYERRVGQQERHGRNQERENQNQEIHEIKQSLGQYERNQGQRRGEFEGDDNEINQNTRRNFRQYDNGDEERHKVRNHQNRRTSQRNQDDEESEWKEIRRHSNRGDDREGSNNNRRSHQRFGQKEQETINVNLNLRTIRD